MPRPSGPMTPMTISDVPPVGPPSAANILPDQGANQVSIFAEASGADVTLADSGTGTNTLWYYHKTRAVWARYVQQWQPAGLTILNGYADDDLQRGPVHATAFHLQATAAVNLGSLLGFVQTVRGGA